MGDTIDNIKGVPGHRRERRARADLQVRIAREPDRARRGDLRRSAIAKPLLANIESARQSRELARIRTDVPVEFDAEALRYRGASRERCFEIFNELAFRTLVAEYAPTAEHDREDLPDRQHA